MNVLSHTGLSKKYDYYIFLFILLALSLFMVCWFGPVSEYGGHDFYFNIGRFQVLMQALQNGTYPIYIDYDALNGYGYFTKGFYPDLLILPFAALGIFTSVMFAYNAMIFTMTFLCGLFMYQAVNTIFKNNYAASVSAILYTFSAYHLFDWYNRAAIGESISFTFLPLIFLGLYHIIAGDYRKWYLLTIGYSLLIYTHLLSSFLTFITLALILLICIKPLLREPKRIGYLFLAAVVTIPVVASYLFTMMEQMASNTFHYAEKENITGQTKLGIVDLGWGFLSGIAYPKDNNLAGIGPVLFCILFLRLFVKEKTQSLRIADICLLMGAVLFVAATFIFPWGRLPLGFIQFPWRLYEFVVFFFAIAGGYYLSIVLKSKKQQILSGITIILFTIVLFVVNNNNYQYWQTKAKKGAPEWFTGIPSVNNEYYLGGLEYLPTKLPSYYFIHDRGADSIRAEIFNTDIDDFNRKGRVTSFKVNSNYPDILELPLVYYKGYKATLDSQELPITESSNGLVQIPVGKSGKVEVYYAGTPIQQASWYVTLVSAFALVLYVFISKKKTKR